MNGYMNWKKLMAANPASPNTADIMSCVVYKKTRLKIIIIRNPKCVLVQITWYVFVPARFPLLTSSTSDLSVSTATTRSVAIPRATPHSRMAKAAPITPEPMMEFT